MINIPKEIQCVIERIDQSEGTCYLVGGCVRDDLLHLPPKDFDIEVFGLLPSQLHEILSAFGPTSLVGESFGVYKLRLPGIGDTDFSLPRIDSKIGKSHKDFLVNLSPNLSTKQAAARRDYTINSIMYDPITHRYLDHFGGSEDLEKKILRPTSEHFAEDPLRILRGMQFAARFGMTASPELRDIGRSLAQEYHTIPKERIWEEWLKWSTLSVLPSKGLRFLQDCHWIELYPELHNLIGIEQNPIYHPEIFCDIHISYVCDTAVKIADRENLIGESRAILLLAGLCHDFGKATTTIFEDDKWKSPGHAEASVPLTENFLDSIGCLERIKLPVLRLVHDHMMDVHHIVSKRAFRRLMVRLSPANIIDLHRLMEADHSGRPPLAAGPAPGSNQLLEISMEMPSKIEPIMKGRHLLETGRWQPGIALGKILKSAFEAQLDGEFEDLEGGMQWVKQQS